MHNLWVLREEKLGGRKRNEELIRDIHRDVTEYSFSFLFIWKDGQIKTY